MIRNGFVTLFTDKGPHLMAVDQVVFTGGGVSTVTRSDYPIPLSAGPLPWKLYGRDGIVITGGSIDVPTTQDYRTLTLDIELENALCATS